LEKSSILFNAIILSYPSKPHRFSTYGEYFVSSFTHPVAAINEQNQLGLIEVMSLPARDWQTN